MSNPQIKVIGLTGIPKISPGTDLTAEILNSVNRDSITIENGDILVIAQSIISKSIGRIVNLNDISPTEQALELYRKMGETMYKEEVQKKNPQLIQLILDESKRILRAEHAFIVETNFGFICANAGIDKSNVEGVNNVTLLPINPDFEANKIRKKIKNLTNKDLAIIISDSFGRPFRRGSVGVALGISGISALLDKRGSYDLYGKELVSTIIGQVDNLASAAQLIMGEANEGLPVILIKGYYYKFEQNVSIKEIFRPKETDLFNVSTEKDLIYQILKSRRSYKQKFSPLPVNVKLLKECIKMAGYAPSAHNAQHWKYIIINKKREDLISKMNQKLRRDLKNEAKSEEYIRHKIEKTRDQFLNSPHLILLCLDEDVLNSFSNQMKKENEIIMGIQSISASAAYFLLAIEANGLAACWYCAPLFTREIIEETLNLPSSLRPMAFFTIGYAIKKEKPTPRKKLEEIIFELGD